MSKPQQPEGEKSKEVTNTKRPSIDTVSNPEENTEGPLRKKVRMETDNRPGDSGIEFDINLYITEPSEADNQQQIAPYCNFAKICPSSPKVTKTNLEKLQYSITVKVLELNSALLTPKSASESVWIPTDASNPSHKEIVRSLNFTPWLNQITAFRQNKDNIKQFL